MAGKLRCHLPTAGSYPIWNKPTYLFIYLVVLGFELRASTQPLEPYHQTWNKVIYLKTFLYFTIITLVAKVMHVKTNPGFFLSLCVGRFLGTLLKPYNFLICHTAQTLLTNY
jgi:hypothetical protein